MFLISIVVVDCFVEGHYSVAVCDASVTEVDAKVTKRNSWSCRTEKLRGNMGLEGETRAGSWLRSLGPSRDSWLIQAGTEMIRMNELKDTKRVKWRREAERQVRMMAYLSLSKKLGLSDWKMEGGRWKVPVSFLIKEG